jgi:hypothetical protein
MEAGEFVTGLRYLFPKKVSAAATGNQVVGKEAVIKRLRNIDARFPYRAKNADREKQTGAPMIKPAPPPSYDRA